MSGIARDIYASHGSIVQQYLELACDPLRGSHDSQSPHIWVTLYGVIGYHVTLSDGHIHNSESPYIRKHLCPI